MRFLGIVFFCMISVTLYADQKKIESILATVDGEPITLLDVILQSGHEEALVYQLYESKPLQNQKIIETRRRILDDVIERKLIWKAYQRQKYPISNELVESTIDQMAQSMTNGNRENLYRKLIRMGITKKELYHLARQRVACDLMVYEFCFRRIVATPRQMHQFYLNHLDSFKIKESRKIALLSLENPSETMYKNIQEILEKDSSRFTQLVSIYSDGPNIQNGGSIGDVYEIVLNPILKQHILNAPLEMAVLQPITVDSTVYFFKIFACQTPRIQTFSEVKNQVKQMIEEPIRKKKLEAFLGNLRRQAIIRYHIELN